jgi:hypothetical protein
MIRLWVRFRRGGPAAVAGHILMLLAAVGGGLALAGYSFPVQISQSSWVALWRVGFALLLLNCAVIVTDVVVAAAAQIRDRFSGDHRVQIRPCAQLLMGLAMLLNAVLLLSSSH